MLVVKPEQVKAMTIRVISGNFSIFANFTAVKYFSLSLVAMVMNTAPLMTFLFAMIFFKEKVTLKQVLFMILAFVGVLLMIQGNPKEEKSVENQLSWVVVLLLLAPVTQALSQLAMKAMQKMNNDNTVTAYMQLSFLMIFVPVCLVNQYSLSLVFEFGFIDWLLLIGASVVNVTS
jgi:drug/metabolite transporter (DMT)-like permease